MRHNPDIKPCFHLAAFEQTQDWDPKIVAEVGRIWQIAMYDETVHTYCCEMTPSYEMHPVYVVTERRASDRTDGEILSWQDREIFYVHTHSVIPRYKLGNIFEGKDGEQIADWNNEEEYQQEIDNFISELNTCGEPLWFKDGEWKTDGQEERT